MQLILDLLKTYKVQDERDFFRLGPRFATLLDEFATRLHHAPQLKKSPFGLSVNLRLTKTTLPLLTNSRLRTLGKKMAVYSASTAIELPGLTNLVSPEGPRLVRDVGHRNKEMDKFFRHVAGPCLTLKAHIEAGLVSVVPRNCNMFGVPQAQVVHTLPPAPIFGGPNNQPGNGRKKRKRKSSGLNGIPHAKELYGLNIVGPGYETLHPTRDDLLENLFEESVDGASEEEVCLYLPYVKSLSVEEVRRAKEEYFDQFVILYAKLEGLFTQSKQVDSESKVLELMKAVDHEVRKLRGLHEELVRTRRLKGYEVAVGTSAMALSLMAPPEVVAALAGAIGAMKAFDGVFHLARANEPRTNLLTKDFYAAWHFQDLAKQAQ